MAGEINIAIAGDSILNKRVSVCQDQRFLKLIEAIRGADLGYTHLETLIHDYDGPEIYPGAEAGWTWMRSPKYIVDELKWSGFQMVSHASNHALDFSFGGLKSTWAALKEGGLVYAGTGNNLAEARAPAYLETTKGRIALISSCSSFTGAAKAGEQRADMQGRPGLNPLRYYWKADGETIELIKQLMFKLGWTLEHIGKTWLFYAPGIHMATYRVDEGDQPGVTTAADENDVEGHLRSIREAKRQADWIIIHSHNHEWDANKDLSQPPQFVIDFARQCIDAGADVFVSQGSHSFMRGLEVYKNKPIFYDPGDFYFMSNGVPRLPTDFYMRPGYGPEVKDLRATASDGLDARIKLPIPLNPTLGAKGGERALSGMSQGGPGSAVAICSFSGDKKLTELKLLPFVLQRQPRAQAGIPLMADDKTGRKIIEYMAAASTDFGTKIDYKDGVGLVKV
jgi:poly-gamma-glutamate capsule biosynthesis protein CapA/YwtB (metallophosphatase superfamily)